ncbi:MAG: alcohol dehydrogenase catalytic domain-containing protein [Hyphomicrobiales bacterium]|nr:alcohol dehydrogenase catalytic domain-containing protein [Hyphomicrobiales bacterium]
MKALVIPEPGASAFTSIDEPVERSDEVILQVDFAGLCGSDMSTFKGLNPLVAYPRIPGHEIGGTILSVGADVASSFQPGQFAIVIPYKNCGRCSACRRGRINACRYNETLGVQRDGGLTERIAISPDKLILNDTLPKPHLALVEPLSVGFHAVRRATVTPDDIAVVIGGGMIGVGALIAAAQESRRVFVVEVSEKKREQLLALGAEDVFDPSEVDVLSELNRRTGQEGADVVIEAVGLAATYRQSIDLVNGGGRVAFIGYAVDEIAFDTKQFNLKELDMFGSRNATRTDFEQAVRYLEANPESAHDVISYMVPWAEADGALPLWDRVRQDSFKVMIDLST